MLRAIWYHLCYLKKYQKRHGGVLLSVLQAVTVLKVTRLQCFFSRFLNYTNGTESRKASHI